MATINYDDGAVKTIGTAGLTTAVPGHGRNGPPMMGVAGRAHKVVTGRISFDNSYPTGGEDISDIFDLFPVAGDVRIIVEHPFFSAGTGKWVRIDYTNKKALLFTNAATPAEVANASDQSGAVNLAFMAFGPR